MENQYYEGAVIKVCALYKFIRLSDFQALQDPVLGKMKEMSIRGTLLLAAEGINGTISGETVSMGEFIDWLQSLPQLGNLEIKTSYTATHPFKRSRVKLKKEIVTMGVEGIDPNHVVGTYVEPEQWNQLIDDPEVLVIDTRNEYEIGVGKFENAINPHTTSFREFPAYAREHLDPNKHRKVAMYCTGGIRCEKSTAYLKQQGFENVFHLKGGILKYLEKVPASESKWQGECFVFDERVTVDHDLEKGSYDQCHACRLPITEQDKLHKNYQAGVSCPACFDQRSESDRERYAEREKQMQLAERRGETHIGPKE